MTDACRQCEYLRISKGDKVPYGDTYVRLPDEWECLRENCILGEEGLEDGE